MTRVARIYLAAIIVAGAAILAVGVGHWRTEDPTRFAVFLGLFAISAILKGRVPGITGSYSPVFFFVLLGSTMLSLGEIAVASALAGALQCIARQEQRPTLIRIGFNASNLALSSASGFAFINRQVPGLTGQAQVLCFLLGASVFYVINTGLVSVALTLVEGGSLRKIWNHWCLGSLPYYLAGSLIVTATISANSPVKFFSVILLAPPLLLATMYYRHWLRG